MRLLLPIVLFIVVISPVMASEQLGEGTIVSDVLGRTVRLNALCDDFEDKDWHYDYQKHSCYRGFWRTDDRGDPKLLARIATPDGGKSGSTGALEIRTNNSDSNHDPNQEDLLTVEFNQKLGSELTRADQPVFIVRVWLPPFDQWSKGQSLNFGFRQTARPSNGSEYYASIWLYHNTPPVGQIEPGPRFVFRIGTDAPDVFDGPIKQPGWWTLAIAFDEKGVGHYYARPGVDVPTEKDEMFSTVQFRPINGTDNPLMDHMGYSFFSLSRSKGDKVSPRFVIDDYEVWIVSNNKLGVGQG